VPRYKRPGTIVDGPTLGLDSSIESLSHRTNHLSESVQDTACSFADVSNLQHDAAPWRQKPAPGKKTGPIRSSRFFSLIKPRRIWRLPDHPPEDFVCGGSM
jgi:hypothetical protein